MLKSENALKKYFGFNSFRTFGGKPLQKKAVDAAINSKSILVVFPTGGGKSLIFQIPALMSGENVKGLTVVISPLQSLMKDQVDNLEKLNITEAVTINGLLDPIERAKSFERVESGEASILYISPESLRSKSIERLLLGRNVVRFVIDEAHCFSAWGQDFRVDYLYIGDFIKSLQETKNLQINIPVSCFTATAKQNVIKDIIDYFQSKLGLQLEVFNSNISRTNLNYKVLLKTTEEEKYNTLRNLLDAKHCPAIVYVSRTKQAYDIAKRLSSDGYLAKPYHGKMEKQEKTKNQDAFIKGDVDIMVATSAFGMGVDKKDVGLVIHYDLSDSLENYMQEAGRAGRDENLTADCYVLFNEADLNKHFILLKQTKLNIKEIQQIWRAIKKITYYRQKVSNSALEIARKAGWDDNVVDIETRVTTAISALEEAGYLKRSQNMPRIYATSILSKNAQDAVEKINLSKRFNDVQKKYAVRIIKKLFSSKSKKQATEESAESRIDYISDQLGILKEEVINVVNLLKEEKILADTKDLTAFIKRGDNKNKSLDILNSASSIENFLLSEVEEEEKVFNLKNLNEQAEVFGCLSSSVNEIKTIINFWAIKNLIVRQYNFSKDYLTICIKGQKEKFRQKLRKRHELAHIIIDYLYLKSKQTCARLDENEAQDLVEFSICDLKEEYENKNTLFKSDVTLADIEDALFYLSRIEAIKIEGGFLVIYNKLTIERIELDNKKQYKLEDYRKLNKFYENKVQQIHIVGEYAKKMLRNYKEALQFVEDYFNLNYGEFLNKYFKGDRLKEITQNITPAQFEKLFGKLSPAQLSVIKDNATPYIVVAAGPGSGKTRVLVHKLASLAMIEDVKYEQLLMLTFSRAAATEFKKRLIELVGNSANFIEIKTFHSYCFDLLGKVGSIGKSDNVVEEAVKKIENKKIELSRITKTVLVIDEAQDMNKQEFSLVEALMRHNQEMRVILAGDDDQNIYKFRGSNSKNLWQFIKEKKAKKIELLENYRSKANIVEFANKFATKISNRLKENPIVSHSAENGLVKVIKYASSKITEPIVDYVSKSSLDTTTCILVYSNFQAIQIAGLLSTKKVPTKLIQTNNEINLYNLLEVRYFVDLLGVSKNSCLITEKVWVSAKKDFIEKYKDSSNFDLCINLINEFELVNPRVKYHSDFEIFIKESKFEDFVNVSCNMVYVSTIHKAKGKEFDNVHLVLDKYDFTDEEKKKIAYVGMTRAKNNLVVHLNNSFFDDFFCSNLIKQFDNFWYKEPEFLIIHLTYRDVWLDFFRSQQKNFGNLRSGDNLKVFSDGCVNFDNKYVLRFSKSFIKKIADYENKGYKLIKSKVNQIVYWIKKEDEKEVKIILPELKFIKKV